ncbi:MAG TPA: carbohydrate kinase family protein [Patescibacteria group bacterium]|nr:carbohydrate kinase family protein [Patescibacteria group bacterium]
MIREYDVITLGGTTMDAFMTLDDTHNRYHFDEKTGELAFRHGEKINVKRYDFSMGGNATNVAVGLSRLGFKTTICSEIGDDEMSIKIRNTLAQENIERLFMVQTPGRSNFSVIINFKGERTIFSEHILRENNFDIVDATAKYIYITSLGTKWHHAYEKMLTFAKEQNAVITFNPGNPQFKDGKEIVEKVMKHTEILFLNKEEAELLLFNHYGEKDDDSDGYLQRLATKLQKIGAKIVVITNGKDGSYCLDQNGEFFKQEMQPGEPVERTGAGDAYTAGFLAAHMNGRSLPEAMQWGSYNAAAVVAHIGAEAGLLTKEEMEAKVK